MVEVSQSPAPSSIPLVDLQAQYRSIRAEIDTAIRETIDTTAFIMGERVADFERAFAEYCGSLCAVACSSGTTALHLALIGCGVGPGDEVVVPSHTFIATAEAVCHCGATPVFADIDSDIYTLCPSSLEAVITPRTKAVIPVHIYGQCADMRPIMEVARSHGLYVVEDCAQAHGARYGDAICGTIGDFGCFSFYPGKNLGAYGDGGILVTNDGETGARLRMLANHGRSRKYEHELIGYNYRLDALQAAILSAKLPHLATWSEQRQRLAHRYNELLQGLPVEPPQERFGHVYHLYVIQTDRRDELLANLKENGVGVGIHYPIPLHLQPCFRDVPGARRETLPVTERLVERILSLPLYPELSEEDQGRVVGLVRQFYGA